MIDGDDERTFPSEGVKESASFFVGLSFVGKTRAEQSRAK